MKLSKSLSIVIFILGISTAFAQQLPQFTQYMFNTISINPAYAGSRETFSAVGLHRSQWVGLEGGPETQTLSVHTPLRNEKVGLGLSFINDKLGYENFSYIYGDFSYTIQTGVNTKLAFGIKGGFTHYNLDEELLNDPSVVNDPFFNEISNRWSPNVGAGLYWHSQRWYVGLSAPRILNTDYNNGRQGQLDYIALERVSYYITGGYVFDLSETTKLKPSVFSIFSSSVYFGSSLAGPTPPMFSFVAPSALTVISPPLPELKDASLWLNSCTISRNSGFANFLAFVVSD